MDTGDSLTAKRNTRLVAFPEGLILAGALGAALLLLSFARIAGDLMSPAGHIAILESAVPDPIWRSRLAANVIFFATAMGLLHLLYGFLCWCLAWLSQAAFGHLGRNKWLMVWYLATLLWLLIHNALNFPRSSLGEPYQSLIHEAGRDIASFVYYGLSTFLLLGVTLSLSIAARHSRKARLAACIVASACLFNAATALTSARVHSPTQPAPNVFILGIDSLRPDVVSPALTPNIHDFLGRSVHMTDTITPLARTFPSWISLLTGRHPHTTGALMNLIPRESIDTGDTIADQLQASGYSTYYAIDETRFSNIDSTYGFDHIITPTIGGSDFVLSLVADTPLSNLVINTRVGGWLFPHIHTNRAAVFTYDPDAFIARIERSLRPTNSPVFLAAHLTLPHFPYTWAHSDVKAGNSALTRGNYFDAVKRADQQFGDLMELLATKNLLDNALVVLISDHGEALGLDDDTLDDTPVRPEASLASQRWGHGSSVFSPAQYQVVLAFRGYGSTSKPLPKATRFNAPTSLLDVTPTILDVLNLPSSERFDGHSLRPLWSTGGAYAAGPQRIRFTETEYNPHGFSAEHISSSALREAAKIYRLNPSTDRIEVHSAMRNWILSNRQFGAILGSHAIGAAIPAPSGSQPLFEFVSISLDGHPVSEDDQSLLRTALRERFQLNLQH